MIPSLEAETEDDSSPPTVLSSRRKFVNSFALSDVRIDTRKRSPTPRLPFPFQIFFIRHPLKAANESDRFFTSRCSR